MAVGAPVHTRTHPYIHVCTYTYTQTYTNITHTHGRTRTHVLAHTQTRTGGRGQLRDWWHGKGPSLLWTRRVTAASSESLGRSPPESSLSSRPHGSPPSVYIGFNLGREPWPAGRREQWRGAAGDLWRGAHAGAMCQPGQEKTGTARPGQPCRVWPRPGKGGEDGESESWVTHRWQSIGIALLSPPAALGREPPRCKFTSLNGWCYSN